MEVKDRNGNVVALYVTVMETRCIHCQREINIEDGMFMCLSSPYCGCLHMQCAPYFSFNGSWPHANPATFYNVNKTVNL